MRILVLFNLAATAGFWVEVLVGGGGVVLVGGALVLGAVGLVAVLLSRCVRAGPNGYTRYVESQRHDEAVYL